MMFRIALDVCDRETINEIANREPMMDKVREELESQENWTKDDVQGFDISTKNLERWLQCVHQIYITQA